MLTNMNQTQIVYLAWGRNIPNLSDFDQNECRLKFAVSSNFINNNKIPNTKYLIGIFRERY